jgi:hypothetical protein
MKRIIALSFFLLTVSLACQTVQRVVSPAVPTAAPSVDASAVPLDEASPAPDVKPRTAPTPITCTDDSCLNACLARINQELASIPLDEVGGDYEGADANFNLVTYKVEGDQITEPDVLWVPSEYKPYQKDTAAQERVWNYFTSLIPAEQRKWITNYVVFTDGTYNTLAWVGKVEYDDNSRWELGMDVLDSADPVYLTETLTHEVAHLLTLNSDQIIQSSEFIFTPYQNTAVCPNFISTEGCSTPESYINQFYQKFWVDIYEEWMEIVYKANPTTDDERYEVVGQFYDKHPDEFAREYAATNIKEDMAVSFEHFVLEPKPTGNSIIEQKILFYYDFPELVALRQQMIQSICSYVQ